jgi:hypothetical protein
VAVGRAPDVFFPERIVTETTEPGVREALARVKPAVRALHAYTLRPYQPRIKLNQNESPFDVPDAIKARIAERLAGRPWNR